MSNLPPGCTDEDVDLHMGRYHQEGWEAAEAGHSHYRHHYHGDAEQQWLEGWDAWHAEHDADTEQEADDDASS